MQVYFKVAVYEFDNYLYIFPMQDSRDGSYFLKTPSLKVQNTSSIHTIGESILQASKNVTPDEFDTSPNNEKECCDDVGFKTWISFMNKSRHCIVHTFNCSYPDITVLPAYRDGNGYGFDDDIIANIEDQSDIGKKVLQALQVYEPKYPQK